MSQIEVDGTTLRVRLGFWERLASLRGDVTVRRDRIRAVRVVPEPWREVRGFRSPGYSLPGHALLGIWRYRGGRDFVSVRAGRPGLVVEMAGGSWRRLILGTSTRDAAEALAAAVQA